MTTFDKYQTENIKICFKQNMHSKSTAAQLFLPTPDPTHRNKKELFCRTCDNSAKN